eukprot:jgi/Botrbrau1/14880/Bobra.0298s0012.1
MRNSPIKDTFNLTGSFVTAYRLLLASIIGSIILLCCAFMAGANYTSHPTILKWKLVALPPLGMAGTILVKVLVPLVYNSPWVNVSGSFLRAAVIITNTSRFNLSLYGLGAVSVTGGIFLRDLAFHAALSLLGTLWNEDECRLLCEAQPDLSGVYKALDGRMSSWLGWTSFRSDPVRTCVVIRIFLQTTLGGLLPIALAYSREVKERAAFLDGAKIRFPKRKVGDFFWDGLFCFGAIVVGVGITAALVIAFPELHRLPLILVKGWGAENFI